MPPSRHQNGPSPASVSLPSIQEMFPEHLLHIRSHAMSRHRANTTPSSGFSTPAQISSPRLPTASTSQSPHNLPRIVHPPRGSPDRRADTHYYHRPTNGLAFRRKSDPQGFSYDVLRSDPARSSLQHLASSVTLPNRGAAGPGNGSHADIANGFAPAFRVLPSMSQPRPHEALPMNRRQSKSVISDLPDRMEGVDKTHKSSSSSPYSALISFPATSSKSSNYPKSGSPEEPDNGTDDGDLSGGGGGGKKHICPTCSKRFNRPSSLRIHVNTHTGATPFRCPWQNCGREFNVNSNMRRHYRNHTSPGFSRSQSNETRRRRRRAPPSDTPSVGTASPALQLREARPYMPSPPISSLSMGDDDSDDDVSYSKLDGEEDELESSEEYHMDVDASSKAPNPSKPADSSAYDLATSKRRHHAHMHMRSFPRTNYQSSSSPSASPPPCQEHYYSPSAPYLRSFAHSRVSTALRPAYTDRSVPTHAVKDEPISSW